MRKRSFVTIISIITLSSLLLNACKSEPVKKTRFGLTDAMSDGPVLAMINGKSVTEEDSSEEEGEVATGSSLKTAKSLDIDQLPENISKMIGLCDAINMVCVEKQKAYTADDEDFMWHCAHVFVINSNDKRLGLAKAGSYIEAEPDVVKDIMCAMFGKLREVPQIPESAMSDDDGMAHISMGNNLKYRFSAGDRGMSEPEVRRVTQYSDGSLEMEVALIDSETHEETVCFIYSMRANTRDTTTSARYAYEITGARSADKATSDKISGLPYLVPVVQTYGYDSYAKGDPRYDETCEIMMYASFNEHVPGMEELNSKIRNEVLSVYENEVDSDSHLRICSYPVSNSDYIQLVTSVSVIKGDTTASDIHSYNYIVKKNRVMDENDALAVCEMTKNELYKRIISLWEEGSSFEGIPLSDPVLKGFIIRNDGSADMFCTLAVADAEGVTNDNVVAYNSSSDSIRVIPPDGDVLPESETDSVRPKLTHGREDQ